MAPISAVVIGAGQRGRHVYGRWALDHPDEMRIVAVVDPDPNRRAVFADEHGISQDHRFDSLKGLTLDIDAAIIATPDRAHHAAAVWAMDAGLHTLLEKPMTATLEDSLDLVDRAAASKGTVHVGHVLRHTPFFQTVHQI
ncbi:MAG TPA: Gfo/Idh/MocA family oxidoreductase, partial [Acidimicrobiia bacterium]|nr:Gfo/Idh/MocA family oxidoreductase [Acidimicrobiia bacterium]